MKTFNFDKWDDFVEITLFGETHKVRLGTFNDAKKISQMQKEMEGLGDNEVAEAMLDFLVERFNESGANYTKEQFMNLPPAKVVAITRAVTQGDSEVGSPLEGGA